MKRLSVARRQWLLGAVAGLIAVAAGYATWRMLGPTTPALSERVVRQFVDAAAREVRRYRRSLDEIRSAVERDATAVAAARAAIEAQTSAAIEAVEAHAARARQRIQAIEPLSWRTRRNRLDRIGRGLRATKEVLATEAEAVRVVLPATP